ncbi:L,D-transpeptidase [Microcoleus sp. FACHB-53]|nr:L,D-transpeptidase [Microcoleus sp. FACHB-53]MBD2127265.1 L,D-transpeptidase [Microcoleus sp. FACHB-1]
MTVTVRVKSPEQRFIFLCLSAAILALSVQRQGDASSVIADNTTINTPASENLSPFAKPQVPRLGEPSLYVPSPETELKSTIDNTSLVIKLSHRRVYVYHDDNLKRSYPIAVGKAGWETPTGRYQVIDMRRHPAWEHPWNGKIIPPGRDNPLGVRWIGFWTDGRNFIGFHGTPDESLVGQAVSHGCIRMRNKDVLALYALVKIGTPVTVEP